MTKNLETKIDWVIHATTDRDGMIHMHTHGLKEKGLIELSAVEGEWNYTAEEMSDMINTVARLMVEGEEFVVNPEMRHIIDDPDDNPKFKFTMSYAHCDADVLDVEDKRTRTIRLSFIK